MGNWFHYPLQHKPISYYRDEDYDEFGQRKEEEQAEESEMDKLHRKYCAKIFAERALIAEKRKLFTDVSDEEYADRFPLWAEEDIGDLRAQFEILDLNRDDLIDFKEMSMVLDEFGDVSTEDERKKYFAQIDLDKSNTIDFEEFLIFLNKMAHQPLTATPSLHSIVTRGTHQVKTLRGMSVYTQLTKGLF